MGKVLPLATSDEALSRGGVKLSAPATVVELVERFHTERDYLRSESTKEILVRRAYIDPLFSSLGWDLDYD